MIWCIFNTPYKRSNLFHFNRIKIDVCIHDNAFDVLHSNGELLLSLSNEVKKKIEYNLSRNEYPEGSNSPGMNA